MVREVSGQVQLLLTIFERKGPIDIPGLKEVMDEVLFTLEPDERKFLDLAFGLSTASPLPSKEIAKSLGTSPQRVERLISKGLRKLRHPSRSKKLAPFVHAITQTAPRDVAIRDYVKSGKHLFKTEHGLLPENAWVNFLSDYDTRLVRYLRNELDRRIGCLTEKFNYRQRGQYYFGYCKGRSPDKLYIYIQRTKLVVDIAASPKDGERLRSLGFNVSLRQNYQGKIGWLTGWDIPYGLGWEKRQSILEVILEAF